MCKDELYYWAVDLLKEMIEIPSVSRQESDAATLICCKLMKQKVAFHRKGNNVWASATAYDPEKKTILLNSHIDTVKPVSGWSKEPFKAEEESGVLYGLGSNDAGASVVSLLAAFLFLRKKKLPYNLIFSATAEEEVSGDNGISSILAELPPIDVAIVGEPTRMQAAIAEKGLMVLDCKVSGKSGHAARNEGVNAIYEALPVIEKLRNFKFAEVSPLLGEVKVTVTMIQAGTQHNVVPDSCTFVVDVRTNELYSNEEACRIISQSVPCEVIPRSFKLNSSRIEESHPLVQRALTLGINTFGSPTLSDQSRMDFPSLKIGPGDSARSHTADEYIRLEEIREGIELYIQLLDGITL